jgi:hypothetical protein
MLDGISMLSAAVNARVTTCNVDWTSMLTTSPCRREVCNVNASLPQQQQQQQHFHYTLQMILFSEKSRQTAHRNRPAAHLHLRTRLPPSTTPGPSQSSIFPYLRRAPPIEAKRGMRNWAKNGVSDTTGSRAIWLYLPPASCSQVDQGSMAFATTRVEILEWN